MTRTKSYVAVYERDPDSDAWLVHIKGIDGCHTYGRSLRQAEDRIREALALWLDRDSDGLVIAPEWPKDLVEIASAVSQARCVAEATAREAGAATVKAAKKLDRMGLSRRDAADILGVSHQRVQQLLAG
ncbi:MAG: type II toxin-antitoxin system HicB family antitoxin [Acidimicrobiia bacterium]|nr:type II toxin-antitoxin system HicB family antitoxin [Acidimicrobiia bacterium]